MDSHDHAMQLVNKLAFENGRLRFLAGEAITYMSHAETFIESREKMHPEGVRQWGELIDRLREVIADSEPEPLGNESALLVGGEIKIKTCEFCRYFSDTVAKWHANGQQVQALCLHKDSPYYMHYKPSDGTCPHYHNGVPIDARNQP